MSAPARIGIVAAADLSRHVLKNLLLDSGYGASCFTREQLAAGWPEARDIPDAWLLDAAGADLDELLDRIVSHSDAPLLINDEDPPVQQPAAFALWRRRLLDKLEEAVASIDAGPRPTTAAPEAVWVLAASTGGPEAVSRFLAALSPGLPIALVYAQHIEAGFECTLASSLARHAHLEVGLCRGEQRLRQGSLLVVPANSQVRFLPFHRVVATRRSWSGPYRPAIDQVIAELARLYHRRCGVIVFSGTCDDGAVGCRVAQAGGGLVWVQSPDSCVSPDMPNAALATGAVSRQGDPEQLARELAGIYAKR